MNTKIQHALLLLHLSHQSCRGAALTVPMMRLLLLLLWISGQLLADDSCGGSFCGVLGGGGGHLGIAVAPVGSHLLHDDGGGEGQ